MHIKTILHEKIQSVYPIHKVRLNCLLNFSLSLSKYRRLSVTNLGRDLLNENYTTKTAIRTADKLVGNKHLNAERHHIYKALCSFFITENSRPVILIDWSDLNQKHGLCLLRAVVASGGQGLTLYEEVHKQKQYNNQEVHEQFLENLKEVLPKNCHPIIVTDAGFRNGWFKAVLKLSWDYVGRVRSRTTYMQGNANWACIQELFNDANATAKYLGDIKLAQKGTLETQFVLVKKNKLDTPHIKQSKGIRSGKSPARYRQSYKEPWLLVTSLTNATYEPEVIVALYKKRMQIEASFRHLKSKFGLRNSESRTRIGNRYSNLLLIGVLAQIIMWLSGRVAEILGFEKKYQANTQKDRKVLSTLFLGGEVLKRSEINLSKIPINALFRELNFLGSNQNMCKFESIF